MPWSSLLHAAVRVASHDLLLEENKDDDLGDDRQRQNKQELAWIERGRGRQVEDLDHEGLLRVVLEDEIREKEIAVRGNGADRQNRLTAAGYNYAQVQARVNQLL